MDAEEIKNMPVIGLDPATFVGKESVAVELAITIQTNIFLKEIAYQLAVANKLKVARGKGERDDQFTHDMQI